MRDISVQAVSDLVRRLFLTANYEIGPDIESAVTHAMEAEPSPTGKSVLCQLCQNYQIAREEQMAICQDTGMPMGICANRWWMIRYLTGKTPATIPRPCCIFASCRAIGCASWRWPRGSAAKT